jgi:hypothetical protein
MMCAYDVRVCALRVCVVPLRVVLCASKKKKKKEKSCARACGVSLFGAYVAFSCLESIKGSLAVFITIFLISILT